MIPGHLNRTAAAPTSTSSFIARKHFFIYCLIIAMEPPPMATSQNDTLPSARPANRAELPEHEVHWFALLGSLTMSWSVSIALGYWAFG